MCAGTHCLIYYGHIEDIAPFGLEKYPFVTSATSKKIVQDATEKFSRSRLMAAVDFLSMVEFSVTDDDFGATRRL